MINSISCYPDGIDSMVFFQDNDIDKVPIIEQYNKFISEGKYTEANGYMSRQDIFGYFADVFNMFENRIYNLQSYLLIKEKINPFISSEEEPTTLSSDMIWI